VISDVDVVITAVTATQLAVAESAPRGNSEHNTCRISPPAYAWMAAPPLWCCKSHCTNSQDWNETTPVPYSFAIESEGPQKELVTNFTAPVFVEDTTTCAIHKHDSESTIRAGTRQRCTGRTQVDVFVRVSDGLKHTCVDCVSVGVVPEMENAVNSPLVMRMPGGWDASTNTLAFTAKSIPMPRKFPFWSSSECFVDESEHNHTIIQSYNHTIIQLVSQVCANKPWCQSASQ
jgi:hypothetical protein